ncbi:MAG TPA: AtpZ/AtpI family protein [Candidatus Paceibacterota bacterium]
MDEEKQKESERAFSAWALAFELGWQIAIPLVLFALLGRYADRYFDTSPWLLVVGVVIAAFSSSYLIYRKVSRILK